MIENRKLKQDYRNTMAVEYQTLVTLNRTGKIKKGRLQNFDKLTIHPWQLKHPMKNITKVDSCVRK